MIRMKGKLPLIFTLLSIAGMAYTTIKAMKQGPKLEEALSELPEEPTAKEIIKKAAPVVAPVVVSYAITVGCVVGAFFTADKLYKGALASTAAMKTLYDQYREKNIELNGEETDKKVIGSIVEDRIQKEVDELPDDVFNRVDWYYDPVTETYFKATRELIFDMERAINQAIYEDGVASMLDVFGLLKNEDMPEDAAKYGWNATDLYSGYYIDTWCHITPMKLHNETYGEYYALYYSNGPWEDYFNEYDLGMDFKDYLDSHLNK